jgi:hypothetical protein
MVKMRNHASSLSALALFFLACLLLADCNGGGSQKTPTEPAMDPAMVSPESTAASNGHGGGGGHGHGHHGSGTLDLAIAPDTWNTEWSHSSGTVQAFIRGAGIADIDLTSLQLSGPGGTAISPTSSRLNGNHVLAHFAKMDAIKLIGTAKPGDKVTITLTFTMKGASQTLTESVRVVGPTATG